MKRITNLPAMNKKLFLGLWFVLFASVVLLSNWLFTRPLQQIDVHEHRFAETDRQITRLKAIYAEFLLSYNQEGNLFVSAENAAETEARSIIQQIRLDLNYYRTIKFLGRQSGIKASLEEFSSVLTGFENNLNDFFLASRERGNLKGGTVSRWQELSTRMLAVTNSPEDEIIQKLNAIKLLESGYLLQKDPRLLEDISIMCEEIRGQLLPEEGGIDLADLDNYMTITGSLISLEKRIGSAVTDGILGKLSGSMNDLPVIFENTRSQVNTADKKMRFWCNISQFLVLLLILTISILLFNRISGNLIFTPLRQMEGLTGKIAEGELPEEKMNPGQLPEITSITKSLERLVTHTREKVAFTRVLNEGKSDAGLTMASDHDQLGDELIKLQQKMIEAARQQRKNEEDNFRRRYINEGLAKFGDILRSKSNDTNALGEAFIREIVKYLNAVQGGFFVFDDSDKASPVLNLVSAFAYNRKKYLQNSVAYGEGLVGTCARERQTINLTELPAEYISITSGLGETLPDNLLLVPVLHESEMIGVLEVASLLKYKDHEIRFAEEVARSLGSTIIYARNNQRTAELLAKSQQQALEMLEQEEEMRQNMEELKATQEESARREEEFRGIAQAIEQALFVIEYDLEGIIRKVNDRFCIFIGRSAEEIVGHQHHEILTGNVKPDRHFWDEVIKNRQIILTEQVKIAKKSIRLQEHFTTVQNNDNLTVKFINFITDDRTGNS